MRFTGLLLLLALVIVYPWSVSAQDDGEIASLVEDVTKDSDPVAMSGYGYRMEFTRVKRILIGRSTIKRRYKALLPTRIPKGRLFKHPLLLVYDNSRRLEPNMILQEQKRIIQQLDEIESKANAANESADAEKLTNGYMSLRADENTVGEQALRVDILKLLKTASFKNLKKFDLKGRRTISLEFDPSQSNTFDSELFYLGLIEGIVLIDELDKRVIGIEAYPVGKMSKYGSLPETEKAAYRVFYFRQQRMREGYWFPYQVELNFMEFPYQFNRLAVKIAFAFTDYKQFSTAVESLNIESQEGETEEVPAVTESDN